MDATDKCEDGVRDNLGLPVLFKKKNYKNKEDGVRGNLGFPARMGALIMGTTGRYDYV
jgi:hypothetical protein